jgi:hypothetical protein
VWNSATTQPFCSTDPSAPNYCFNRVAFRVRAQAPNTGENEPREDVIGSTDARADLLLAADVLETTNSVVAIGGFVDLPSITMRNDGGVDAGPFSWGSFLRNLEGGQVTATGTIGRTESLAAGSVLDTGAARILVPHFTVIDGVKVSFPAGNYLAGINVDETNAVDESDETNNSITSSPIRVVGYTAEIDVSRSPTAGRPFAVTVSLRGPDGAAVRGAAVSLSLEGPGTVPERPGPPGNMTPANPSGVTNVYGKAFFTGLRIGEVGGDYRIVAVITVPDVGTLAFQSTTFKVLDKW